MALQLLLPPWELDRSPEDRSTRRKSNRILFKNFQLSLRVFPSRETTEVAIKSEKNTLFLSFFFLYTTPPKGINLEFCSGNVAPHFNKSERAGIKNFYEPPSPPLST